MGFSDKLIIGGKLKSPGEIIEILKEGTRVFGVYLICINKGAKNIFEIISSVEFSKPIYTGKDYLVIGVAENKKEAAAIIESLLKEYYSAPRNEPLKKYFLRKY
ncbi:MAG: hypothetical protein LBV08_08690 [Clostridiales bacterium]|jgi:hypothetical protein|nr:hypothetical protein [Clostridiales bacterium]